ncbi:PLP-dependent aminotransferase family protein [Mesorhizobium sp. M1006]|uniref:aminotransferase-like domain-containing protein n=1 Tax=unclassified Mesorhizobium TaxID=325217 RepID=UPI003336DD2A
MMTRWSPVLDRSDAAPLYRQLVDAMAADIANGRLPADARLPPHRELAHALSISVGAVTRAYGEATERGLIAGHVGRGTFVIDRSPATADTGPIDLTINLAPINANDAVREALSALRRRPALVDRLGYQSTCGLNRDRQAAAAWLTRTANLQRMEWQTVICCSGAQNAMAIALTALCAPGDPVLCEAATFPGAKALASQLGHPLRGVEMDAEGATPQALDRAAAETGARLFYTLPTLQNPTARTMGLERRAEIVRVARARGLWLIEDDVYAPYARHLDVPPLAALAPERTIYVSSLSKIVSPGLRAGFLVAPTGEVFDRCARAMRALMHSPAGINSAVTTQLIESGRADEIASAAMAETRVRTTRALAVLGDVIEKPRSDASLHVWLPMPEINAERAAARASYAGIRLTSPAAFAVASGAVESGLRLCVGSVASGLVLERALIVLRGILMDEHADHEHGVI